VATLDCEYEDRVPANSAAFILTVKGLLGGHSGDDINKGHANAVKLLTRLLWNGYQLFDVRVADINAGNLRNAIPREGFAHITVPNEYVADFEKYVAEMRATFQKEFFVTDPGIDVELQKADMPSRIFLELLQLDLMNALFVCPNGVQAISQDIPNFVETSTNLASVKVDGEKIIITTSQRSSVESRKENIADKVATTFYMIAADIQQGDGYPGWTPNPNSEVLKVLMDAYKKVFNKDPEVKAIHAGLECGLFSEKYPGLDMVSYGPTLRGVHSPDEKLLIPTVKMCWDLTVEFLKIVQ
jgi:dipeptidase D